MTNKILIKQALTPIGWQSNISLTFNHGLIQSIDYIEADALFGVNSIDCIIPGYIDTQVNGGGGVLFNRCPSYGAILKICNAHARFGTTSMMPTVITDSFGIMQRCADAIAQAIDEHHPGVVGIHFEGPHLAVKKRGVHSADLIRRPSDQELALLMRKDLGRVLVTIAPETVPVDVIRDLVENEVIVSLGHSNAGSETVAAALDAGATGFTHLYNAMSALQSREPGMVGQALMRKDAYCGLIVDHHHVHPDSAKLAIQVKTPERIMLVTDAMAHAASAIDELPFFDSKIVRRGNKLTTPDGTLAGSCLDMHQALCNTHKDLGFELAEVSCMASKTPASFLGIDQYRGSIAVGQRADFIALTADLSIAEVWQNGVVVDRSIDSGKETIL